MIGEFYPRARATRQIYLQVCENFLTRNSKHETMSHDFLLNGSTRNEEHTKPRNGDYTTNSTDAASAATAVLKPSVPMPSMSTKIRGVDFNDYLSTPITVTQLTSHLSRTGFQASNLARAIEIINNMVMSSLGPHVAYF